MPMLIHDRDLERRLIARRRRLGHDRLDEVWEGVYVMSPLADDEHQAITTRLAAILDLAVGIEHAYQVRAGINVSDRTEGWKQNYRCPDVAVFLPDTHAVCHGVFWHGGPDLAVEIRSKGDRARKKRGFYAAVGTRELLIVDRGPSWGLELYRLREGRLESVGRATAENGVVLVSEVVPLAFGLESVPGRRPAVRVEHADGARTWRV
jgi:Uma2 family endonuclease